MNAEAESQLPRTLEEQLFLLLAKQARRVPFPVILISAIVAGLASRHLPPAAWAPWLVLVAVILVARGIVLPRLPNRTDLSIRNRLRIAVLLSGINGLVHGSSLGFFIFLPEFERALQTMLLAGLCTGAVATTAGYRSIFLAFFLPIFPPLFVLWAWSPGSEQTGWVDISVAILVALFGAILIAVANDSYRLFRESFELGAQKDQLNRQLQATLDEKDALNQQLRTALDETDELNAQLRTALAEADAAGRAKTRFLASASHDLRQPLHTLTLYGAALAMRPLDDRTREIADQMDAAMQALASQFNALLDISRLDAGVVEVNVATVNLTAILERSRFEFEPLANDKGLALNLSCPPDVTVAIDEVLFERIVSNLLSNAVKYTDSGQVDIDVEQQESNVVVAIRDTGRGIPGAELDHVFEEFYQLSNPHRDRKEGFGLGLSIVRRMLDLLRLEWRVESEEGKGTSFFVSLPTASATDHAQEAVEERAALDGLHVLAVDDEVDVAMGTKTLLEEMGCTVTVVDGTEPALVAVNAHKPDVLLVDFRLRDGDDGLKTVSAARKFHPGLPAILISGDTAPDRLREADAAGLELLHKPVSADELRRAIAAVCDR